MSKPTIAGQPLVTRAPAEQLKFFADLYRPRVDPASLSRITARTQELNLQFTDDELQVFAALDTPARVQEFLNTQVYYNNDHAFPGQEETAQSPRGVLRTGIAHCFEGALFALMVNYLHGHSPQMVILEATEDSDHNLIVYRDGRTQWYGCNAHSAYAHLDGRAAEFETIRALAESYHAHYYSDYSLDPSDLTLVGYSAPFDLVARYGTAWMDSTAPLWEIYFTYVHDRIPFYYLHQEPAAPHIYPMLNALKQNWIRMDGQGRTSVSVPDFPGEAQSLWKEFWQVYNPSTVVPRGDDHVLDKKIFQVMRLSPLDLMEYVREMEKYFARGYRLEQILG